MSSTYAEHMQSIPPYEIEANISTSQHYSSNGDGPFLRVFATRLSNRVALWQGYQSELHTGETPNIANLISKISKYKYIYIYIHVCFCLQEKWDKIHPNQFQSTSETLSKGGTRWDASNGMAITFCHNNATFTCDCKHVTSRFSRFQHVLVPSKLTNKATGNKFSPQKGSLVSGVFMCGEEKSKNLARAWKNEHGRILFIGTFHYYGLTMPQSSQPNTWLGCKKSPQCYVTSSVFYL